MGVAISSRQELEAWLEDKPREWAQVIALRAALRVLPFTCDPAAFRDRIVDPRLALAVFRASAIPSGARKIPPDDIAAARTASAAAYAADAAASAAAAADADAAASAHAPASDAARAAYAYAAAAAADAAYAAARAAYAAAAASDAAYISARAAYVAPASDAAVWLAIGGDCDRLEREVALISTLTAPLWHDALPEWLDPIWARASAWLDGSSDGFGVWREWYQRKLDGERFEFASFDADAENEFFTRLFAQNDEWWDRELAAVNADIADWVTELAKPKLTDAELNQNPTVINFALDADGRTVLAPEPLPNGLQDDPDARDTHAEIRRLIDLARLVSAHGTTQAVDMLEVLDLLAQSAGSSVEGLRPRLFVLRGKELIRQVDIRQRDDPVGLPLSVPQINAFVPLIEAVRQCANEDPKLRKLWHGPESDGPPLTKRQLEIAITVLNETGQTTAEAQEPLAIATEQVPANASENDPARRTASEMVRNVFRSIGKGLKKVDEGTKSADRWIKLAERATQIWAKVRQYLPDDEFIARLLDWISKGGGSA
jgi:hypothetical protein